MSRIKEKGGIYERKGEKEKEKRTMTHLNIQMCFDRNLQLHLQIWATEVS
jgi:hypothetical protein